MELVYICSPYRGDIEKNVKNVRKYCRYAMLDWKIPIAPHLYFTQFLDDDSTYDRYKGIQMGTVIMAKCSEIWIIADEVTEGMVEEITEAKKLGIKMVFMDSDMKEVTYDNYFVNKKIGPGFRRVIEDAHADSRREECAECDSKNEKGGFWSWLFGNKK